MPATRRPSPGIRREHAQGNRRARRRRDAQTRTARCHGARSRSRPRRALRPQVELDLTQSANHASLRDDIEVSCPELDVRVASPLGAGAFGTRTIGGRFGGSAIALLRADEVSTAERARCDGLRGLPPSRTLSLRGDPVRGARTDPMSRRRREGPATMTCQSDASISELGHSRRQVRAFC